MDLLLWRWSTTLQFVSLLMLAAFFVTLSRSSRRAEARWWVMAWLANLIALGVTVFYWYSQPAPIAFVVRASYIAFKLAFVLLLIQGVWTLAKPGEELLPNRVLITTPVAYGFIGALFIQSLIGIGVAQHVVMAVLLVGAAIAVSAERRGTAWLATGMALRGMLSAVEAWAYAVELGLVSAPAEVRVQIGPFLAASSSFDTGAEWFIALGCVLAIADRAQRELRQTNENLLFAQEHLRRLADRDPLTALDNRRSLPDVFRNVQPGGATMLFFDLDGFKQINDRRGHAVGDQCLRRFAVAVRESFRPTDAVVRYGGDEFVVVAGGLDRNGALERVDKLRHRLAADPGEPRIGFSCGVAVLEPGGSPEQALHDADRAMYASRTFQLRRGVR
jgi:diguanylate cyclase (GGDEF)-like protein